MVTIGPREHQNSELHTHRLAVLASRGSVCTATNHLVEAELTALTGSRPMAGVLSTDGRSDPRRSQARGTAGSRAGYTVHYSATGVVTPDRRAAGLHPSGRHASSRVRRIASSAHRWSRAG